MVVTSIPDRGYLRDVMNEAYRMDEAQCVKRLLSEVSFDEDTIREIEENARKLISEIRSEQSKSISIDTFLNEYDLSSEEGITLMCLAESLLRVPDKGNINRLIRDKLSQADWTSHLRKSNSSKVNVATWALMLTGKVLTRSSGNILSRGLKTLVNRTSEPVIRQAVAQAMKIMSRHFVSGHSIEDALQRGEVEEQRGFRFSYDMLGEAARTHRDAKRYFQAYRQAIVAVGTHATGSSVDDRPGVSIKLSALHPRYEPNQYHRVLKELTPRVLKLALLAKRHNVQLTIDAEEAERLDLSLDIFEQVLQNPALNHWDGFGLAVQSYQKRAWYVIDWLADLANRSHHKIRVRLIKGAYWDTEVKRAQMAGLEDYPVFTRKNSTDVSFIACAKKLLDYPEQIFPQFATHNAHSVAAVLALIGERRDVEFQALYGMGRALYEQLYKSAFKGIACRIYAPVGNHEDLLPYLVRRLLENGANSSFVHRIVDPNLSIDHLVGDPFALAESYAGQPHPRIPKPVDIFQPKRSNSLGMDFSDSRVLRHLIQALRPFQRHQWRGGPVINGKVYDHAPQPVASPASGEVIGQVSFATQTQVESALTHAEQAHRAWDRTPVHDRAQILRKIADVFTHNQFELIMLLTREAGKTLVDALAELREAIDFCHYYAQLAVAQIATPTDLTGYTGETNQLRYHGRGLLVCISPWNFPLAIFTGQIVAALVTGNCVLAKPAGQTSLIATRVVQFCLQAGVPPGVLQLVPGSGKSVGGQLIEDNRTNGVIFTGSTQTAAMINQQLATRSGPMVPLIAETGGQNAMIVDSSALPEQVVEDVIVSAFGSAGQRCSACRVLFLQTEVADKILQMLVGAMAELQLGEPSMLQTDVGPVIDETAYNGLQRHIEFLEQHGERVYACPVPENLAGHYMPPTVYKIPHIHVLPGEVFGPILHVVEYRREALEATLDSINQTGFGLTLGIHSRIDDTVAMIRDRVNVGNIYVNRNMIGAVVGLQPFGGEGLSGTGPKAGGPNYLLRLCLERLTCTNTTAAGGNTTLMSMT